MKIVKKLLIIVIIFSLVILVTSNLFSSFAVTGSDAQKFNGEGANYNGSDTKVYNIIKVVLAIVRLASVGIGVIMLTVLGAKYMLASPNERADIKQHAIVFVIGAFIMFGASALVGIAESFATKNISA